MGPVGLVVGAREHTLAGIPAQLATMLCCAGDAWISLDELIDAVWADSRPASARSAIHVHLGTVRRWLTVAGPGPQIQRSTAGYRMGLGGVELDFRLMVDLLDLGHRELSSDPDEAAEILRYALSMPRGAMLELAGRPDAVAATRQRLDGCRLTGEEDLVEALLAIGSFPSAETVALRLVDECPFREIRWAQLMRTRYLDNRPGEALRTYGAARDLLIDELGTEPGPMLQNLERMVLMHDRDGLAFGLRPRSPATTVHGAHGPIVGRDMELRRCLEGLAPRRVVVVSGPPGVGKTRLAQEACRLAEATSAVVWVDLHAHADPMKALAFAIGAPPGSGLGHVCDLLAGLHAIVVLDNAEHVAQAVEDLVRQLVRALPGLRILITSRVRLSVSDIHLELRPLPIPASDESESDFEANPSVRLLHDALADLAPSTRLSRSEVVNLCQLTGGLPLALRLAAGELRALGTSARVDLAAMAVSGRLASMVRATLELRPVSRQHVFASLSVLACEFDAACGSAVSGMPIDDFLIVAVDLVDAGLVEMVPGPPASYRILPPLRDVVVGDSTDRPARKAAMGRLVDHVIVEARALGRGIRHGDATDDIEARTIGVIRLAHTVIPHLEATGDAERALELAGRLDAALYTLGWWTEKNELLDRALAIPGPASAVRARARALRGRAGVLSQFDLDHLTCAEQMATELGVPILAAYAAHLRSIALWWRGDCEASLDASRIALDLFTASGRTIEMLEARKFVGLALLTSGRIDDGFREQHEVLAGFEHLGIAFHVAHSLALLGHSHRHVGDDDAARVDFERALEVCRRIGNRGTIIHVHLGLGDIAADRGSCESARRHAADALDVITRSRLRTYEPWAWTLAMRTASASGDLERALGCAHHAIATLDFAPGGDAARFAFELADVALLVDDPRHAARLIGAAEHHTEPREMPLLSPHDQQRYDAVTAAATRALGDDVAHQIAAGRRCTIAEAAGDLLARPDDRVE